MPEGPHYHSPMRLGPAIAAMAILVVTAPAAAKNGEVAHLLVPPPTHARTGTLVTVEWTVGGDGTGGRVVPFAAAGMFVRLVGAHGVSHTALAKQYRPPYSARVQIPAGGVLKLELGLQGWTSTPTGTKYAPEFFPIG
jgi:hypothetical protein